VTAIQDASGSIAWTYNALGQVTQERKTTGSVVYIVGYSYDLDGNVTQISYPSGRTVNYARDATGLVTGVTTKATPSSSVVTLAANVAYLPFGPLQSLTYGNDLVLWKTFTQDYNPNTLLVERGANSIVNRSYTYWNGDFSITNIWDSKDTARTESYVYTPNQRLQNTYADWGELTYWQDGVGNRTADIFNDGSTTTTKTLLYPYNNNRIAGVTQGSTTLRTITHDGAGNIVTDVRGGTSYGYRYNNRGRLDRLTVGATVKADYAYDGLERMAVRTTQNMTPSATTHYVYDRAGRLLAEASGTGTTQREYVWIDDLPLALFADLDTGTPKQWFVHPDHLNRPTKMTDASQTVVWDAYYWPYGEIRAITGSASNNLRFPGQYYLVESGLHYNWHRHYDPTLGRYTQPDPLQDVIKSHPEYRSALNVARVIKQSGSLQVRPPRGGQIGEVDEQWIEGLNEVSAYVYAASAPALFTDRLGLFVGGQGALMISNGCVPDDYIKQIAKKRIPYTCVNCGAKTGGLYYPYCPDCYIKSLDPKGGVAPIPKVIDPKQYQD
jgi:RHS repeat-associated protein